MAAVAFGGREAIPPGTGALLERMAEELKVRFLLVAESPGGAFPAGKVAFRHGARG